METGGKNLQKNRMGDRNFFGQNLFFCANFPFRKKDICMQLKKIVQQEQTLTFFLYKKTNFFQSKTVGKRDGLFTFFLKYV